MELTAEGSHVGLPAPRDLGRRTANVGNARRQARRLDLAHDAQHLENRRGVQILTLERFQAGQQLVQHDAQRVDVGARVHVERSRRLLRAHVFRRPEHDAELRMQRAFGEPARGGFATPKSITFATGWSSCRVTRMFDGLRSRWMMPFWCACWTAAQTCRNSSRRAGNRQAQLVAVPRDRQARDRSMTKKGRPSGVAPASRTAAMPG